jgi:hypothetical protein
MINCRPLHSPSKFTSLRRLEMIRRDNYQGEGGKEYSQEEVDQMIVEKQTAKAESFQNELYDLEKSLADLDREASMLDYVDQTEIFDSLASLQRKVRDIKDSLEVEVKKTEKKLVAVMNKKEGANEILNEYFEAKMKCSKNPTKVALGKILTVWEEAKDNMFIELMLDSKFSTLTWKYLEIELWRNFRDSKNNKDLMTHLHDQ